MTILSSLPTRRTLLFLLPILLLTYFLSPSLTLLAQRVRQTHPWSHQHAINQPFTPTPGELACLHGTDPSSRVASPMPNIVHFIYGLRNPLHHPSAGQFDFLCYLALRSAIIALGPNVTVNLHYTYLASPPSADYRTDPMTNSWVRRLAGDIKLVNHPPEEFERPPYANGRGGADWHVAHVSDVFRLQLLKEQGGIYMDIDAFALKPFDDVLKSPQGIVLGHEGGNRWGLCNAIMAARPNASFIDRWLESYVDADLSKEWNYHSVLLPKEMQQKYPEEVCALPPTSFFWPTWTWDHVAWMHERLSRKESAVWQKEIRDNDGSLFQDQIAYHAWNQMAYDRYMKHLTPHIVRTQDTRFNLLMRRFIEDDVE